MLSDNGRWAELAQRVHGLLRSGVLERSGTTWVWHRERDPDLAERLAHC